MTDTTDSPRPMLNYSPALIFVRDDAGAVHLADESPLGGMVTECDHFGRVTVCEPVAEAELCDDCAEYYR